MMTLNSILQFVTLTDLNYTVTMSNAISHLGTVAISYWLMTYIPSLLNYYMVAWLVVNSMFGLYMYSVARLLTKPNVLDQIMHEKHSPVKEKILEQDTGISSSA
jgi:uncharacterized membrane protein YqhA